MSDNKVARAGVISPSEATMKVGESKTFTVTGDTIRTTYTANGRLSINASTQTSTSVTVTAMVEGEDALNIIFVNSGTASVPINIVSGTSGDSNGGGSTNVPVTGISVDAWEVNLEVGQTRQMIASVVPSDATNQKIWWWSETESVATVSDNGLINAKGVGTTRVSATTDEGGHAYNIQVTVTKKETTEPPTTTTPVSSVSLNKTSTSLKVGQTETLVATVNPSNATNRNITWSSNNTSVATVDNGVITAKAKGSATITVRTSDGNKTATCAVTVTEATPTPPTNNAPTISLVLVSNETASGGYTLSYTANDPDGDTLTHKLKIDNGSYSAINPTKNGTSYTFNGSGLNVGTHTGQIQVSDGSLTAPSELFNITIRAQATGVKAQLKEAKDIYDEKHTALKTTINSIIADGKFNEATEKNQLDQAFSAYNMALAQFKKMAQKAIDFIGDIKKDTAIDESKVYTNAQIKIVSDSITQRVERVEEKQTTVDGKVSALETWKSSAEQKITADAIISTVSSTIIQAKNEAIIEANSNTANALKNYSTTTEMNSAIQQKTDSITSTVSTTITQAKNEAISEANSNTANSLKNYSTTTQMNSAIQQKADSINATVSSNYTDLSGKIQSANTSITQLSNKITSKVDVNGIISSINQTAESIKIQASKIQLDGATTIGSNNRFVKIEESSYSVFNGNTTCLRFGYKTWNGWDGVPEFLMGYNGFRYSTSVNTGADASYFGMQTWGRNVKGNQYAFHDIYYRSDKYADQHHVRFTEDGLMQLKSLKRLELMGGSDVYVQVDTTGGLTFPQGVKTFGVSDTIWLTGSNFGVVWGKYTGKEEYNLRPTNNNLADFGHASYRWRTLYATNGTVNTSDISLKENIVPITNKSNEEIMTLEIKPTDSLTGEDFYQFVKELPMYSYDYKSESPNRALHNVGFMAQDIADTQVGQEFVFKGEDGLYQYNMQGYVGVLAVALQTAIKEIEKLKGEDVA